jgi:hypothetical protein
MQIRPAKNADAAEISAFRRPWLRLENVFYGGDDVFGEVALLFGSYRNTGQYFAKDGELIPVRGAPTP